MNLPGRAWIAPREWVLLLGAMLFIGATSGVVASFHGTFTPIAIAHNVDVISASLLPVTAGGLMSLVVVSSGVDHVLRLAPTSWPAMQRYWVMYGAGGLFFVAVATASLAPSSPDSIPVALRNFGLGVLAPTFALLFVESTACSAAGLGLLIPAILPGQSPVRHWLELPFWEPNPVRDVVVLSACMLATAALSLARLRALRL